MADWNKRAQVSGKAIAKKLSSKSRPLGAIVAGLEQFEADLFMAFVDHDAPNPELLTAKAMTVARRHLNLLQ